MDAAASSDLDPEQYREAFQKLGKSIDDLTYVAETPPIQEAGICARPGLDPKLVDAMREALFALNAPEYKPLLKRLYSIDGFAPARDEDYDPVNLLHVPLPKSK